MKFYPTLEETLAKRFEDNDEVTDIANYGCDTGVSDFTYTYEINEFFNEFENEIEDHYYEIFGDNWLNEVTNAKSSMNELRAWMVWGLVGDFCSRKYELMEAVA